MTDTDIREQGKQSRSMDTSDSWQDSDTPAGGIGTLTRPTAPPSRPRRPAQPATLAPPREPKGAPPSGLRSDEARNELGRDEGRRRVQAPGGERGKRQLPFFLLLCILLGGALVCALVITTTLAEGSYRITKLQQSNNTLMRQRQILQEQVAAAQSAQVIESRARQLGMRPAGELRFLNLKTGKVQTDAGSGATADISVPGYTP
jgi:hypothetical protein